MQTVVSASFFWHLCISATYRLARKVLSWSIGTPSNTQTHAHANTISLKTRPNKRHTNSAYFSMTTTKMFTGAVIGRLAVSLPVAVVTQSAPFCLGIAACKCVGVMYSRGMRAHMAAITQTHKAHVVMQRGHRARTGLGAGPTGSLSSENQACDVRFNASLLWICLLGRSIFIFFLLLLERRFYWPNSRTDRVHMDLFGESVYQPHASFSFHF